MLAVLLAFTAGPPAEPLLVAAPGLFRALVNPACSHCRDEAKRRAGELRRDERVLCWTRGYSDGGAIPYRFFLTPYRVISDSYGVFVLDAEAGYARGFEPSFEFTFHGWRDGVMVMRHADGTLYSCLSGRAFAGPRKGERLTPVPTLVSDWGVWMDRYPDAVAYRMFERYKPVDAPAKEAAGSVRSRGKPDPRLKPDEEVLGVWHRGQARAFRVADVARAGLIADEMGGDAVVVLWDAAGRTAAAYRPVASQARKYRGPMPDRHGVSPPDRGEPLPGGLELPRRGVRLKVEKGRVMDARTGSEWDVAGRCVSGGMKGWTLEWVDGVQVRWRAWSAEHRGTTVHGER